MQIVSQETRSVGGTGIRVILPYLCLIIGKCSLGCDHGLGEPNIDYVGIGCHFLHRIVKRRGVLSKENTHPDRGEGESLDIWPQRTQIGSQQCR